MGFTLVEMLIAIALVATAMAITFSTFYSIANAWQRGLAMSDNMDRGEYVMEQLVRGLRSAFFPSTGVDTNGSDYGFMLDNVGMDAGSRDTVSWVKTGSALLGANNPLARGLHRVQVSIETDEDGCPGIAARTWRPFGNLVSFDADQLDLFFISGKIIGMNFRVSTNRTDDGWEWDEKWEDDATNHLPQAVEITLFMESLKKDDPPVEIKRLVEIPVAPLSWSRKK